MYIIILFYSSSTAVYPYRVSVIIHLGFQVKVHFITIWYPCSETLTLHDLEIPIKLWWKISVLKYVTQTFATLKT